MKIRTLFAAVALVWCSPGSWAVQIPDFYIHEEEALGALLTMPALTASDYFGQCVAISGNTLVVGADTGIPDAQGSVYVFALDANGWGLQQKLTSTAENFGRCVAISGNTLVVGVPGNDIDGTVGDIVGPGAVHVFERTGTTWALSGPLVATGGADRDHFGSSVAIDGDTLVVGARFADVTALAPDSGRAYVFERDMMGAWSEHASSPLEATDAMVSDADAFDEFGHSVAIHGSIIVVGAPREDATTLGDDSGAAYVFERTGTDWVAGPKIVAPARFAFAQFGDCVSVYEDASGSCRIAVGAPLDRPGSEVSGSVSMFERVAAAWQHTQTFSGSDSVDNDRFGDCLSLSGDRLVVGAWNDLHQHQSAGGAFVAVGSAYLFGFDASAMMGAGSWVEVQRFCPSSGPEHGRFGAAVAFDGKRVGVGAWQANSLAGEAFVFHTIDRIPRDLCSGDGGDQMGCTNCPCSNNAPQGTIGGCLNSAGTAARLIASGDHSVSLPSGSTTDLRFSLSGAPAGSFCILNSGHAVGNDVRTNVCFGLNSGTQAIAFDGLRCAITNVARRGGRSADANGDVGVTNNPWGGEGGPPAGLAVADSALAGQTKYFQVILREDPLLGCMRGLNTSQAVEISFVP